MHRYKNRIVAFLIRTHLQAKINTKEYQINTTYQMISFDVKNLSTNVPSSETVALREVYDENKKYEDTKINFEKNYYIFVRIMVEFTLNVT